jgi:hypothetical protein
MKTINEIRNISLQPKQTKESNNKCKRCELRRKSGLSTRTRASASEERTRLLKTEELFCAPILSAPEDEEGPAGPSLSGADDASVARWRLRVTMFLYLSSFWMASCSDLTLSLPGRKGGARN